MNKSKAIGIAACIAAISFTAQTVQAGLVIDTDEFVGYSEGEYGYDITGGKNADRLSLEKLFQSPVLKHAMNMEGGYRAATQKTRGGGDNTLWFSALEQTANEVGYNIGFWKRGVIFQNIAKQSQRNLDRIWQFNRLMMAKGRVVPPVIEQADDALLLSADTINISNVVYIIRKQAYITTNAPSWEDYLLADSFREVDLGDIDDSVLPITLEDKNIWKRNIMGGFREGVKDAEATMIYRLKSLREDYIGMTRYHILLNQGMVTQPFTTVNNLGISGDGREMRVGERIIRLEVKPTLVQNTDSWKGLPEVDDAFGEASKRWLTQDN